MNKYVHKVTITLGNVLCNQLLKHYNIPYRIIKSNNNGRFLFDIREKMPYNHILNSNLQDCDSITFEYNKSFDCWNRPIITNGI